MAEDNKTRIQSHHFYRSFIDEKNSKLNFKIARNTVAMSKLHMYSFKMKLEILSGSYSRFVIVDNFSATSIEK